MRNIFKTPLKERVKHFLLVIIYCLTESLSIMAADDNVDKLALAAAKLDLNGGSTEFQTPKKTTKIPIPQSAPSKSTHLLLSLVQAPGSAPPKAKKRTEPVKTKLERCIEECSYLNKKEGVLSLSSGRIALFRGIHFVKNLFDSDAISENVNDARTILVSSAACKLTGIDFLAAVPGDNELAAGRLISDILNRLKTESLDLYHKFHETYTNNHIMFHACLEKPNDAKDPLTQKAFQQYRWIFQNFAEELYPETWKEAVKRNPFVSFSCNAVHALKYAFGQKSFTGGEDVKLLPKYDKKGKPKNKHLGKIYIAILSPADLWKLAPTFVVSKHAQNKVKISTHHSNNILSENEVSFFGYVPKDLTRHVKDVAVPNFEGLRDFDALKYGDIFGIDKAKYEELRSKIKKASQSEIIQLEQDLITLLIEKMSGSFEDRASKIISLDNNEVRIYPDVLEGYYTHISENAEHLRVAQWLHDLRGTTITSIPMQAVGGATTKSIHLLAANLLRQPIYLTENWAMSLTNISISLCDLGYSGKSFSRILRTDKVPLNRLSLKSCKLTAKDVEHIAQSLHENQSLQTLILDDNTVGDKGAIEFAKALQNNDSLERLSLYATEIENIKPFADLFPTGGYKAALNSTLQELNLDFNLDQLHLKKIQIGLHRNLEQKGVI